MNRRISRLLESISKIFINFTKMLDDNLKVNKLSLFTIFSILFCQTASSNTMEIAEAFTVKVKNSILYPFAEDKAGTSIGAGFLVDRKRGWIITNAHVSGYGPSKTSISFKGKKFSDAYTVYVDADLDIAILATKITNIPDFAQEAELDCDASNLIGRNVAAFGHPKGLSFSASRGIISQVRFFHGGTWVQTDAAINSGNSGGALVDINSGKVLGVNTMGLQDTEGLSFAVPIFPVCKLLRLLRQNIDPSPPKLPFSFASNLDSEEHLFIAPGEDGKLPNGLEIGDQIIAIDDIVVSNPSELKTIMRGAKTHFLISVQHKGELKNIWLKIEAHEQVNKREFILLDGALISRDVYPERWVRDKYFQVQSVQSGSLAEMVGIKRWKSIVAVNGVTPKTLGELATLLNQRNEISIMFRGWSNQDNLLYDYEIVSYRPENLKENL